MYFICISFVNKCTSSSPPLEPKCDLNTVSQYQYLFFCFCICDLCSKTMTVILNSCTSTWSAKVKSTVYFSYVDGNKSIREIRRKKNNLWPFHLRPPSPLCHT